MILFLNMILNDAFEMSDQITLFFMHSMKVVTKAKTDQKRKNRNRKKYNQSGRIFIAIPHLNLLVYWH